MRGFIALVAAALLATASIAKAETPDPSILAGKWTYRAYRNNPALVAKDAEKALENIFLETVFTFEAPSGTAIKGTIDLPDRGWALDIAGTVEPDFQTETLVLRVLAHGRPGTATASWGFDYHGYLAHQWENGVDQVPAIIGTVISTKPFPGAPPGFTASFIAVKQP